MYLHQLGGLLIEFDKAKREITLFASGKG